MREEEKKAVEHLNSFLNIPEFVWIKESELLMINVKIVLNLIENQQKELDNLKEIEKSHQEENGKLRVKLTKQEKMIEYMVNWINDHEDPFEGCHENEKCGDDYISCEQCIKQYFEKKAEEEE